MKRRTYSPHKTSLNRFDRRFFTGSDRFTYIGSGELGGKAHGLAMMKGILESSVGREFEPEIAIRIPTLVVVTTGMFDLFMKQNDLSGIACADERDEVVGHAFQRASLPVQLAGDLRALVETVHSPLAVRSSSLLEDAMFEPFASVYATKMVPNNQPSADARFKALARAIKFVYASTFFRGARNYMKATHHNTMDEKMAVVIQEVVGDRFGERFYPHLSGVMRSFNFYPTGHAAPEDGIVELALGLGRTIVDDGVSWAFSPAWPRAVPPFKSTGDMLKHSQTTFWAVNMDAHARWDPLNDVEYMDRWELGQAEYDGTIDFLASTYLPGDDRVVPGIGRGGPRVMNFAPILRGSALPLADCLARLKEVCEDTLGTMVEIEFAARLGRERPAPADLGFLQVRPMVVSEAEVDLSEEDLRGERVLLASGTVLGNGESTGIRDVVYIDPDRFDVMKSREIAADLEGINRDLVDRKRPYLLIGFGRWGTTDPLGGIPVDFGQISGAAAIAEVSTPELSSMMSQGSHFFHNVTSFRIFYFSVPHDGDLAIDWAWLRSRPAAAETPLVRHVALDEPLVVRVDGRSGRGVIRHD